MRQTNVDDMLNTNGNIAEKEGGTKTSELESQVQEVIPQTPWEEVKLLLPPSSSPGKPK